MDPGTVLAIVSLIIQVVSSADKVIQGFDHIQNAPRELRDFRAAVFRLQRNFETLQPSSLHADDLQPIEETLELCAHLFQQHDSVQSQGMVNSVLRGTWSIRNNQKLTKYRYRIYEHYVTILIPALVAASGRSSDHNTIGSSLSGSTKFQAQGERPEHTGTTVSLEDLGSLRQLVENLGISEERAATERTLSELDRQLRRCWIKLGLQDDDVFDSAGLTDRRRQSNVTFEVAPVTLYMNDVPEQHKKLKLERVHIMARDDESRILLYQNREATIQVTHIVPKGSIPWTSPQYHKRVSFLHPHVITVVDGEGYHLYQVDPQYSFNKIETCESFQSMLRERELRGTFLAAEIREGGVTLCRMQFIRFWRRHEIGKGEILTLTFLQTSHDAAAQHKEVNLANYQATPEYHARRLATVVVRRPTESNTLDIIPRRAHAKSLVLQGKIPSPSYIHAISSASHTNAASGAFAAHPHHLFVGDAVAVLDFDLFENAVHHGRTDTVRPHVDYFTASKVEHFRPR
ncbi:Uu.00g061310.m01.CDS01 [Anthostomella pinea]|uniref:Uu.00g061310.m01.CDS01 n=1 Tax=Anthostomella pinea TaxID=933095 RepID=A0AAI8YK48_9PEZI|nr:Uu.00g061310.m01.CDS01 [Anthostomella pinea]